MKQGFFKNGCLRLKSLSLYTGQGKFYYITNQKTGNFLDHFFKHI